MQNLRDKKGFICDMDGVIYHGNQILDGVKEFVQWLKDEGKEYLFLTNNSGKTPKELQIKLERMGLEVPENRFYTSAMATASFLYRQMGPETSAYVLGDSGLFQALYSKGIIFNDVNPDYVVVGESVNYSYQSICKAVQLVGRGARLIGTNPDQTGPGDNGVILPACKALIAPIEIATGKQAYFIGKPNPLMMRTGLRMLGVHSEDSVMIGDRMDTDVIAGLESGLETCLVLTGVTRREQIDSFPYRPQYILENLREIFS
ncbi:MAG: HAD-IIA family hydrolase [Sphaerochaetaceae bacterium]|jgi:NagD protein|nr:HAD-IIA family hydrolase [Sphaerochaetaceae bacterium]